MAQKFVSSPFMRAYAAAVRAGVPVVHVGDPGQAKTATIEGCAKAWGRHAETLIGSTRESTDFLGVMIEDKGVVKYSTFQWAQNLITAESGLLFLDEFNTAAPSTMKGMLRVVQEGWVGDTQLPESVSIVAAMNPTENAVDAYDLPAPMANRMMHLKWVFDAQSWLENVGTGFEHITTCPRAWQVCPSASPKPSWSCSATRSTRLPWLCNGTTRSGSRPMAGGRFRVRGPVSPTSQRPDVLHETRCS